MACIDACIVLAVTFNFTQGQRSRQTVGACDVNNSDDDDDEDYDDDNKDMFRITNYCRCSLCLGAIQSVSSGKDGQRPTRDRGPSGADGHWLVGRLIEQLRRKANNTATAAGCIQSDFWVKFAAE